MKWISPKSQRGCDPELLQSLLSDDLDDAALQKTSRHLDSCPACQRRLTELSGDASWWIDASRWLEPESGGPDASWDAPAGDDLDCESDTESHAHLAVQRLIDIGLLTATNDDSALGTMGRYRVTRVIGSGGTGLVLRALDSDLNRVVAIKVLSPSLSVSVAARKRFAREGQAVAAVAHENVVAIHQVEASGPVPYLVMQYIDGTSLQEWVAESGPLDAKSALRVTAQVAAALAAAHDQGLVHRDVKPANILVSSGGQRVWITDFGLARAVDDASLTRTGFIAGTPHYMSPEQARGETVSNSSDLFGLGSVLYFMLTGRPPFRAERTLAILNRICTEPHRPIREVDPDVPPAVAEIVDRLLAKLPSARFASAADVRSECLEQMTRQASPKTFASGGADAQVGPAATLKLTSSRWYRTARWMSLLGIGLGCYAIAVFAFPLAFRNGPERPFQQASPVAMQTGGRTDAYPIANKVPPSSGITGAGEALLASGFVAPEPGGNEGTNRRGPKSPPLVNPQPAAFGLPHTGPGTSAPTSALPGLPPLDAASTTPLLDQLPKLDDILHAASGSQLGLHLGLPTTRAGAPEQQAETSALPNAPQQLGFASSANELSQWTSEFDQLATRIRVLENESNGTSLPATGLDYPVAELPLRFDTSLRNFEARLNFLRQAPVVVRY